MTETTAATHVDAILAVPASSTRQLAHVRAAAARAKEATTHAKIMMVDDQQTNSLAVQAHLEIAGFSNFVETSDDQAAMKSILFEQPDVLLLDIMMPTVSGLEILEGVRALDDYALMPVLILTSLNDTETKATALQLGATDFLSKPVDPMELVPRVRNAIEVKQYYDRLHRYAEDLEQQVQLRTKELAASRLELIHCLGRASEYRDNETGKHVVRVGRYAGILARALGLDPQTAQLIEDSAPLHDVGKIGIPDAIMLKPGRLLEDEFDVIKRHCEFGEQILTALSPPEWQSFAEHTSIGFEILRAGRSPLLTMAALIAATHHEKWDGTGYPKGLAGEEIPIEGRITAVADVFDALSSKRPYKEAFPLPRCFEILQVGRGQHFDPAVIDAFFANLEAIVSIRQQLLDLD